MEKPHLDGAHGFEDPREDRAVASFVSMAIGDALGAPMEFRTVCYEDNPQRWVLRGMGSESGSFGLQPGQWTDDASMEACVADFLLVCGGFDPC